MADKMTHDQMIARIAELEAEKLELKAAAGRNIRLKVSEKGGLSVYGLGRFPVTLYKGQWTRLFRHKDQIEQFIKDNDMFLKSKTE